MADKTPIVQQQNGKYLFSYADLESDAKAKKACDIIAKEFTRAGIGVIDSSISDDKRSTFAGVSTSYREMVIRFVDMQVVRLRIKRTGDIFQVLNGDKIVPIKNQDDHRQAIRELVAILDKSRPKVQAAYLKLKMELPKKIRTSITQINKILEKRRYDLKEAIATIEADTARLNAQDV